MSPSTNQQGNNDTKYQTEADRMLATKSDRVLLKIRPMSESIAADWVGACNRQDVSEDVLMHFVGEARRYR